MRCEWLVGWLWFVCWFVCLFNRQSVPVCLLCPKSKVEIVNQSVLGEYLSDNWRQKLELDSSKLARVSLLSSSQAHTLNLNPLQPSQSQAQAPTNQLYLIYYLSINIKIMYFIIRSHQILINQYCSYLLFYLISKIFKYYF